MAQRFSHQVPDDRLFKDYGLVVIECYAATRCYTQPEDVVDDFLRRLQQGLA
jgi:hypothetical protein